MVVHVEAICQFEEANHRRSGGCSDMIAVNMVSARGLIAHTKDFRVVECNHVPPHALSQVRLDNQQSSPQVAPRLPTSVGVGGGS